MRCRDWHARCANQRPTRTESHDIDLMLVQGKQTSIWLCFVSYFLWEQEQTLSPVAAPGERRQGHVKVALRTLLVNRARDRNPDGVGGVMTTPQPRCAHYLVWLNSCRPGVWPQHNTEPTDLSRGIRKSPQHMWFMGSQRSLHISSYPQTAWATLAVFFFHQSGRVILLFTQSFICPFIR